MNRPETPVIPDVQSHPDARELAIDRVGIRGLRYPMKFADGTSAPESTVALFNVYVALSAEQKGTHMSRLVALIDEAREPFSLAGMSPLLDTMLQRLDADAGRIEIEFPWFIRKAAPVSGVPSMMDYQVKLSADHTGGWRTLGITVVVPVMSLCPSSKAISDYGAHNQRSHLTLTVRPRADAAMAVSLAELVGIAEEESSCELYGLLNRSALPPRISSRSTTTRRTRKSFAACSTAPSQAWLRSRSSATGRTPPQRCGTQIPKRGGADAPRLVPGAPLRHAVRRFARSGT